MRPLGILELRIGDPNIKKLIVKFLKAGIMEKDIYEDTEAGVAQGASISSVLTNIYLHYEDKIVQQGLNKLLQAIYEQDFVDHSYGFRPDRSCLVFYNQRRI